MDIKKTFRECFATAAIPVEDLAHKTILVTGASGLIGRMTVKGLSVLDEMYGLSLTVLGMVRDEKKAKQLFAEELRSGIAKIVVADVQDNISIQEKPDYIIHAASMTSSKSFVEQPVEVIQTNVLGAMHVMELARNNQPCRVLYLSSMEAYGFTEEEELLTEDKMKYINPLAVRSCYPESKRMAENIGVAYASEYGVPFVAVRLAQTFGYGVEKADTRVFAEFARCAVDSRDIVLITDGSSKRMYLDTADAVSAILTVLLKGKSGQAYNAANKDTYCSVREMAQMVAERVADGKIDVKFCLKAGETQKFSPPHRFFLDVSAIEELGWKPQAGLEEMYRRLIETVKEW